MKPSTFFCFRIHTKRLILLFFGLLLLMELDAQNLVPNPGFETHTPILSVGAHNQAAFFDFVKHWHNDGFLAQPHSSEYEYNFDEVDKGYSHERYFAHSGKTMIRLPIYPGPSIIQNRLDGSAGYLYTTLKDTLKKGNDYYISFWVHIKDDFKYTPKEDLFFLKQFGIALTDKKLKLEPPSRDQIKNNTPFLLDTIIIGKWYKQEFVVKMRKDVDKIYVGWFQNPYAPLKLKVLEGVARVEVFVDDILINKIHEGARFSEKPIITFPVPAKQHDRTKPPAPAAFQQTTLLFEKSSYMLSHTAKSKLDSVRSFLVHNPSKVLYIDGHTDSTGTDHVPLSKSRALAVQQYLVEEGGLDSMRFIARWHGDSLPATADVMRDRDTANRRVDITISKTSFHQRLYALASEAALKGDYTFAFEHLKKWLQIEETDKILLLFDPDLESLHDQPAEGY